MDAPSPSVCAAAISAKRGMTYRFYCKQCNVDTEHYYSTRTCNACQLKHKKRKMDCDNDGEDSDCEDSLTVAQYKKLNRNIELVLNRTSLGQHHVVKAMAAVNVYLSALVGAPAAAPAAAITKKAKLPSLDDRCKAMQDAQLSSDLYKMGSRALFCSRFGVETRRIVLLFFESVIPLFSKDDNFDNAKVHNAVRACIAWQLTHVDATSPNADDDTYNPFGAAYAASSVSSSAVNVDTVEACYDRMRLFASRQYKNYIDNHAVPLAASSATTVPLPAATVALMG